MWSFTYYRTICFSETVNLTVYCRKLVCTTLLIRQAKMIF